MTRTTLVLGMLALAVAGGAVVHSSGEREDEPGTNWSGLDRQRPADAPGTPFPASIGGSIDETTSPEPAREGTSRLEGDGDWPIPVRTPRDEFVASARALDDGSGGGELDLSPLEASDWADPEVAETFERVFAEAPERVPTQGWGQLLADHPEPVVRRRAVRELASRHGDGVEENLFLAAIGDPDANVRREAALATAGRSDPGRACEAFAGEPEPLVRAAWLQALGGVSRPDLVRFLVEVVQRPGEDLEVRVAAARALALASPEEAAELSHLPLPEDVMAELLSS
mgnify:CR=1 FL=1